MVLGDCNVDELPEEPVELLELFDEPAEPVPEELLELPLLEDTPELVEFPEDFTDACVDPGRTAITTPATATLARDTVTVVVLRRRLPR